MGNRWRRPGAQQRAHSAISWRLHQLGSVGQRREAPLIAVSSVTSAEGSLRFVPAPLVRFFRSLFIIRSSCREAFRHHRF